MYSKAYVEITNICNMKCSFCHGHKRAPRRMTAGEFALILDKLEDKTKYIYYHLMGEPLTHPELAHFVEMAGKKGYKSIITTNGTLLKKRAEELLGAGVHKVNISVHSFEDGSEEEHARYIRELAEFSSLAADNGIITVFRLWNKGHDGGRNEATLNLLMESIPGEWVENTRGVRIRDKIHIEWGERFEWPDLDAKIQEGNCFCYGLKDQFGILVDGTVVPCCLDSEGIINLGNIFVDDIDAILNSERASNIVKGFKCGAATEQLCKRCAYAKRFV